MNNCWSAGKNHRHLMLDSAGSLKGATIGSVPEPIKLHPPRSTQEIEDAKGLPPRPGSSLRGLFLGFWPYSIIRLKGQAMHSNISGGN